MAIILALLPLLLLPVASAIADACPAEGEIGTNLVVQHDETVVLEPNSSLPDLPPWAPSAVHGARAACSFAGSVVFGGPLSLSDSAYSEYGLYIKRALTTFADYVNGERGGLLVSGSRYAVRFQWVDDASSKQQVANATAHALRALPHAADFAIAGYSSGLTQFAARQSAANGRVMVATAASPSVYLGNDLVFGVSPIAPAYHETPLQAIAAAAAAIDADEPSGAPSGSGAVGGGVGPCFTGVGGCAASLLVGFVQQDTLFARAQCEGGAALAESHGLAVAKHADGTPLLATLAADADVEAVKAAITGHQQAGVNVLVGCTYRSGAFALIQALEALEYSPLALTVSAAVTDPSYKAALGWRGEWVLGPTPWTAASPRAKGAFSQMTSADFASRYLQLSGSAAEREEPEEDAAEEAAQVPYQAAEAFASACALCAAIEAADSFDTTAVADALRALDLDEFYARLTFNADGLSGTSMSVLQHAEGSSQPFVVYPPADATTPLAPAALRDSRASRAHSKVVNSYFPTPPWAQRRCRLGRDGSAGGTSAASVALEGPVRGGGYGCVGAACGTDAACNNRGACNATGVCECLEGYHGERCTIDQADLGYVPINDALIFFVLAAALCLGPCIVVPHYSAVGAVSTLVNTCSSRAAKSTHTLMSEALLKQYAPTLSGSVATVLVHAGTLIIACTPFYMAGVPSSSQCFASAYVVPIGCAFFVVGLTVRSQAFLQTRTNVRGRSDGHLSEESTQREEEPSAPSGWVGASLDRRSALLGGAQLMLIIIWLSDLPRGAITSRPVPGSPSTVTEVHTCVASTPHKVLATALYLVQAAALLAISSQLGLTWLLDREGSDSDSGRASIGRRVSRASISGRASISSRAPASNDARAEALALAICGLSVTLLLIAPLVVLTITTDDAKLRLQVVSSCALLCALIVLYAHGRAAQARHEAKRRAMTAHLASLQQQLELDELDGVFDELGSPEANKLGASGSDTSASIGAAVLENPNGNATYASAISTALSKLSSHAHSTISGSCSTTAASRATSRSRSTRRQKFGTTQDSSHRRSGGVGESSSFEGSRTNERHVSHHAAETMAELIERLTEDHATLPKPPALELTPDTGDRPSGPGHVVRCLMKGASAEPREADMDRLPGASLASNTMSRTADPAAEYLSKLRDCAGRMRELSYSLRDFHDDMLECFPELRLYLYTPPQDETAGGAAPAAAKTTSGRSPDEEYKRTIGALFAVYWLARLDLPCVFGSEGLGGQRGFCFGVDTFWHVPSDIDLEVLQEHAPEQSQAHKQLAFMNSLDWVQLHQLMLDSGVLVRDEFGGAAVGEERMMAMLALTAIHDIMKVEALLPTVRREHAPFAGYAENDVISDHDIALGYVLEYDPGCLPCFARLPESMQHPIKFTQAKLGFNHGWLVQAEAPPGQLFSNFKSLIESEGVASADIAFYFVHWLTDLAGAEPGGPNPADGVGPTGGAEKFVLRFPQAVLKAFVRSFPLVQRLADVSCTQLYEEFLESWWPIELGSPPTDFEAIAIERLVVQAQTSLTQQAIVAAWAHLPEEDVSALSRELAYTGRKGEAYKATQSLLNKGPAFLVYYGPALLRHVVGDSHARVALSVLAEVYRAARELWPECKEDAGTTVTVRVDQLKSVKIASISEMWMQGKCWAVVRVGDIEGAVELCNVSDLVGMATKRPCRVLSLWSLPLWDGAGGNKSFNGSHSHHAQAHSHHTQAHSHHTQAHSHAHSGLRARVGRSSITPSLSFKTPQATQLAAANVPKPVVQASGASGPSVLAAV